jgi:serine/threonine protein kinase
VPLRRCYGITQDQFCNPVFWCLAGLSIVALVHDLGRKRSWQDRGVYGFFTLTLAASMIVRALLHQFVGGYSSVTGEGTPGYDWVSNTWETLQSVVRNGAAVFLAADNVGWGGMRHAFQVGAVFSVLRTAAGVYLDLDRWRSHGGSNSPWAWLALDGLEISFLGGLLLQRARALRRRRRGALSSRGQGRRWAGFWRYCGLLLCCYGSFVGYSVWELATRHGSDRAHALPSGAACAQFALETFYFFSWPAVLLHSLSEDSAAVSEWGRGSGGGGGGGGSRSSRGGGRRGHRHSGGSRGGGTRHGSGFFGFSFGGAAGGGRQSKEGASMCLLEDSFDASSGGSGGRRPAARLAMIWDEVQIGDRLGEGGTASVYRARIGDAAQEVAAKCVRLDVFTEEVILKAYREATLLTQINHINVTRYFGIWTKPPNLFILMELVPRGSLYDLHRSGHVFDGQQKAHLLCDAVHGLQALHSHEPQVLHCDLKSLNLLVDESWCVKLADFGESMLLAEASEDNSSTPQWTAPEVLRGQPFTAAADVYSLAMCTWEIWARKLPYSSFSFASQIEAAVLEGVRPDCSAVGMPRPLEALVRQSWATEPRKRPSLAQWAALAEGLVSCTRGVAFRAYQPANNNLAAFSGRFTTAGALGVRGSESGNSRAQMGGGGGGLPSSSRDRSDSAAVLSSTPSAADSHIGSLRRSELAPARPHTVAETLGQGLDAAGRYLEFGRPTLRRAESGLGVGDDALSSSHRHSPLPFEGDGIHRPSPVEAAASSPPPIEDIYRLSLGASSGFDAAPAVHKQGDLK